MAVIKIKASEKSSTALKLIMQPRAIKKQKDILKKLSAQIDSPMIYVQPFKP